MSVVSLVDKASFSAGELDRALHARTDLGRFQTGVAICENMVVMVEGGLTRRPGTRFVVPLRNEAEEGLLIPFEYSADDTYMLIVNDGVLRFMRNGGVVEVSPGSPYELAVPFNAASLRSIRFAQSGNVIFVAWAGPPKVISRFGHTSWAIADYLPLRGPVEVQNLDVTSTISASAATGNGTLDSSKPIFVAGHLGSTWRLDEGNLATIPSWLGNENLMAVGAKRRNAGNVYEVVSGADAGPTPPVHDEGDVSAGNGKVTWRFVHPGSGYVRITAVNNTNQVAYALVSRLPDSAAAPNASFRWFEAAWSNARGWPSQVRLHDNRLVWARGDQIWMTKIGDYYDFDISATEDSAVSTRLTSPDGKLIDIQWMLNSGVIVVGSRSSEWMVRGTDPFSPITISTIRAIPDGSEGSAPHRPQLVDGGAVFIGRSRQRLHYAQFDRISEKIGVDELTLYARNILKGAAIDLGYARDPHRIVWIGQATGQLAGITFRPDQQVTGWHRHPMTNGYVENFGVIPSADASVSETWMIVRRTIGGAVRRYVELMQPFFQPADLDYPTALGAWFVDSGLSYAGGPATHIAGAQHLAGQEVAILADGIEHRKLTVAPDGSIDLDRPASSVVLGLPIRWRVRSLPVEMEIQGAGSSKGTKKKADHVWVEMLHAASGFVGVNGGEPEPLLLSGTRALSTPQPLVTGGRAAKALGRIEDALTVEIMGDGVYPFTLLGLSPHAHFVEAGA